MNIAQWQLNPKKKRSKKKERKKETITVFIYCELFKSIPLIIAISLEILITNLGHHHIPINNVTRGSFKVGNNMQLITKTLNVLPNTPL